MPPLRCSRGMLTSPDQHLFDAAIVGGGPAGLAAAVYLGRFLRSVVLLDSGFSRAQLIPRARNCPGYPEGISGKDMLERLRRQASLYGAIMVDDVVQHIEKREGRFLLT